MNLKQVVKSTVANKNTEEIQGVIDQLRTIADDLESSLGVPEGPDTTKAYFSVHKKGKGVNFKLNMPGLNLSKRKPLIFDGGPPSLAGNYFGR